MLSTMLICIMIKFTMLQYFSSGKMKELCTVICDFWNEENRIGSVSRSLHCMPKGRLYSAPPGMPKSLVSRFLVFGRLKRGWVAEDNDSD